jgi:hypothetical protein
MRISDRNGDCLPFNAGFIWSEKSDYVKFGVNRIYGCKYTATSAADLQAKCTGLNIFQVADKMTAWSIYGIASVDWEKDWVKTTVANKPSLTTSGTSCGIFRTKVEIQYQKFGKQENPRYQVTSVEINYESVSLSYSSGTRTYNVEMTINWHLQTSARELYVPAMPSGTTYLDNDVLYPFFVSAGAVFRSFVAWEILGGLGVVLVFLR